MVADGALQVSLDFGRFLPPWRGATVTLLDSRPAGKLGWLGHAPQWLAPGIDELLEPCPSAPRAARPCRPLAETTASGLAGHTEVMFESTKASQQFGAGRSLSALHGRREN